MPWTDAFIPEYPPRLTDAELRVLAAIEDLTDELGHPPTLRAILERIGWHSKGTLHRYLERLQAKGAISGRGASLRVH